MHLKFLIFAGLLSLSMMADLEAQRTGIYDGYRLYQINRLNSNDTTKVNYKINEEWGGYLQKKGFRPIQITEFGIFPHEERNHLGEIFIHQIVEDYQYPNAFIDIYIINPVNDTLYSDHGHTRLKLFTGYNRQKDKFYALERAGRKFNNTSYRFRSEQSLEVSKNKPSPKLQRASPIYLTPSSDSIQVLAGSQVSAPLPKKEDKEEANWLSFFKDQLEAPQGLYGNAQDPRDGRLFSIQKEKAGIYHFVKIDTLEKPHRFDTLGLIRPGGHPFLFQIEYFSDAKNSYKLFAFIGANGLMQIEQQAFDPDLPLYLTKRKPSGKILERYKTIRGQRLADGLMLADSGYVATSYHAIQKDTVFSLVFPGLSNQRFIPAEKVFEDSILGIGLLKISDMNFWKNHPAQKPSIIPWDGKEDLFLLSAPADQPFLPPTQARANFQDSLVTWLSLAKPMGIPFYREGGIYLNKDGHWAAMGLSLFSQDSLLADQEVVVTASLIKNVHHLLLRPALARDAHDGSSKVQSEPKKPEEWYNQFCWVLKYQVPKSGSGSGKKLGGGGGSKGGGAKLQRGG